MLEQGQPGPLESDSRQLGKVARHTSFTGPSTAPAHGQIQACSARVAQAMIAWPMQSKKVGQAPLYCYACSVSGRVHAGA